MPFFSHSLAIVLWFGCAIGEHLITNRLHERCSRLTNNDKQSTFPGLLKKRLFLFILKTCNFFFTEMYELAKGISWTKMQEIFRFRNSSRYNLRSHNTFEIPFRNYVSNGTEPISYLGPKVGSWCWCQIT